MCVRCSFAPPRGMFFAPGSREKQRVDTFVRWLFRYARVSFQAAIHKGPLCYFIYKHNG